MTLGVTLQHNSYNYLINYRDPDYESISFDIYDDVLPPPVRQESYDMSVCPVYERQSSEATLSLSLSSNDFEMTQSPLYSPINQDEVAPLSEELVGAFQTRADTQ